MPIQNPDQVRSVVYTEQDFLEPQLITLACGTIAVFTRRAPNKETANEDAAALIRYDDQSCVLVVADGLGGERAGKEASRLAVEAVVKAVSQATDAATLREVILDGIEIANREILDLGIGAASTLAVMEIQGNMVRPYHVGDSMILISGQRGKVKFQSVSHSPVGYAVESGLLDKTEAVHHEQRHVVSNVVGTPEMRIDIGPTITLSPRDTLTLASDGLADNLYNEEIIKHVRKGPLATAAASLAQACQQRMHNPLADHPCKPDDLTFILFRLQH